MEQENQELIKFLFSTLFTIVAIIILVIAFILFYSKQQGKLEFELISLKSKTEKEILKSQLEIQEDISNKISREIHDNISLGLTLSKLQINNFLESDQSNKNLLTSSVDLITKSLIDLNDISKSLDSSQLFSHGLIAVLEAEIAVISKSKLIDAEFNIKGETIFLNSEKELIIFRIFQEACNNILKHAKASTITIDLVYEINHLDLKISDDGLGFNIEETLKTKEIRKMSGLKNIYQRSEIIGAETHIYSTPNVGTTIHIKIPFKNNQNEK
jgi:two-component system NarL family sensor kinase